MNKDQFDRICIGSNFTDTDIMEITPDDVREQGEILGYNKKETAQAVAGLLEYQGEITALCAEGKKYHVLEWAPDVAGALVLATQDISDVVEMAVKCYSVQVFCAEWPDGAYVATYPGHGAIAQNFPGAAPDDAQALTQRLGEIAVLA